MPGELQRQTFLQHYATAGDAGVLGSKLDPHLQETLVQRKAALVVEVECMRLRGWQPQEQLSIGLYFHRIFMCICIYVCICGCRDNFPPVLQPLLHHCQCIGIVCQVKLMMFSDRSCHSCAQCSKPIEVGQACDGPDREVYCNPCHARSFTNIQTSPSKWV